MNAMNWGSDIFPPSDPVVEDDALDHPRRELRLGAAIAALFFLGLLGWAAFIPLDQGAFAEGRVSVSGNRQAVQHRDGGVVTRLNVVEGQMVGQGDALLTISASELVANERGLSGEAVALLAQRARLLAERDGRGSIQEPVEFANLSAEDRAIAEDALRGQRLLFNARRQALGTQTAVLNQRLRQHSEQIAGIQHQMRSNREQQRLIGDELAGLQSLVGRGFVATNRIRSVERSAAELNGNYGSYQADVARSGEAIGETRMQMMSLERQRMEEVATQMREVQVKLDEVMPRLIAVREQLARSTVRAPASGRVVGLTAFTVGGVVAPGALLMEIVPENRALVVEARAAPTDADDLRVGMETQIRFPALQERSIPILQGRVAKVSADSLEDERTGQRYFRVEIVVPPEQMEILREYRADGGMRPGLPAEVMIPLRKRTALAYLIEPLTQTLWRSGREN